MKAFWDRIMRAQRHYDAAQGDIYAAGISYFTIFAMFPLLMMGFAVAGFMLAGRPQLLAEIDGRVKATVSGDFAQQIIALMDSAIDSRTSVGVIGLGTAVYVGLLWMQRLRAALSQMWGQEFPSPGFLNTKFSDVESLGSAFVASMATVALSALAGTATQLAGGLRVLSLLGSVLVAWALFTWMIARLPHDPLPLKRCVRAGFIAAAGFELFKQVASIYLRTVMHGPAGTTFGPLLGILVFAYVTARLVLFATAWAATEPVGQPATGPRPADSATAQPGSD